MLQAQTRRTRPWLRWSCRACPPSPWSPVQAPGCTTTCVTGKQTPGQVLQCAPDAHSANTTWAASACASSMTCMGQGGWLWDRASEVDD